MTNISVCKDCPDRRIGCHAVCERYTEESERNRKKREENQKQKDAYSAQLGRKISSVLRMQRRRHH